jgi:hypothetical protein
VVRVDATGAAVFGADTALFGAGAAGTGAGETVGEGWPRRWAGFDKDSDDFEISVKIKDKKLAHIVSATVLLRRTIRINLSKVSIV